MRGSPELSQLTYWTQQPLSLQLHLLRKGSLSDILETSVQCDDQTEDQIAKAELQCYESEPGESLDCQQSLKWWKASSVNYKYFSNLAKKFYI